MSNLAKLAQLKQSIADGKDHDEEEEVVLLNKEAFFMDSSHLRQHSYQRGYHLVLEAYDKEFIDKIARMPNEDGEPSWRLVKVDGKRSMFSTHPGSTASWKFLGGDDYDTFKEITTQMLRDELDLTNYSVTDKGQQPLNRFLGDKEIADDIWKTHPTNNDDEYYFGGNAGEQKLVDELIGKEYNRLDEQSKRRSKFSPKKKARHT